MALENRTEPLDPNFIADLMHASTTLIDDYLDGALTLGSRRPTWVAQARAWAIRQGLDVPAESGVTPEQGAAWKKASDWEPRFDKGDVRAACFVVLSYLTGMRPQEVLHLDRDCLTVEAKPDTFGSTATNYRIKARTFKNVRDANGNSVGIGRDRKQPWVTIAPAAKAVEALRQLSPDESYLFAIFFRGKGSKGPRQRRGDVVSSATLADSLDRFIAKWNAHVLRDGRRPINATSDPSREIDLHTNTESEGLVPETRVSKRNTVRPSQFRRTLAWHIANQTGGEVALGVQYGHLKTVISLGYAGRAESGFPDELKLDQLLANWDQMDKISTEVHGGSVISGPAAPRVREAVEHFDERFEGQVRTESELKRFNSSGLNLIYDNPRAHNVCAYNSALALCHPDRQQTHSVQTPDLDNCQRGCPNIALLDSHATAKATARLALLEESEYLPMPLAERNRTIAGDLQRDVDKHDVVQIPPPSAHEKKD